MSALPETCPNCRRGQLIAQPTSFTLRTVLQRWEVVRRRPFSPELWAEYAEAADRTITLHRCGHCAMQWFLPLVTGTERFYREITEDEYYHADKWEFRRAARDLKRAGRSRVLDIGCGSGGFLASLRDRTGIVGTGFEFNAALLPQVAAQGLGTLADLNDPAVFGSFDAITVFQVIEHSADPMALMDQLDRLLAPGGTYILAVPDMDGPIRHFREALTDNPPHHVSRWGRPAMLALGEARGYLLRYITTEWLPRYLWGMYLPTMVTAAQWPFDLGETLLRHGRLERLIRLLERTPLHELPGVPGHSLYAVFEKR